MQINQETIRARVKANGTGGTFTSSSRHPKGIRRAVQKHLVNRHAANNGGEAATPFLAVFGPSGTGKTTAVQEVCESYGAAVHFVSGSSICGPYEGQASQYFKDRYLQAARDPSAPVVAFVIDDIERSVLNTNAAISSTSSTPILSGLLNSLGDNPYQLDIAKIDEKPYIEPIVRAPAIIMTGNALDELLPTIVRPSRCDLYEHDPKGEDLAFMVGQLFPLLSASEIPELVSAYPGFNISFFASLARRWQDRFTEEFLDDERPLWAIDIKAFNVLRTEARDSYTLPDLTRLADELAAENRSKNYLTNQIQ